MYTIAELMSRDLVTLAEDDSLERADAWLERGHIRHLPVIRGDKLVGLLTHRDLLRHNRRFDPQTGLPVRARDVMVREVVTVQPETPVREAIRLMLNHKFGCLPVIAPDGKLLGILTDSDLLRVAEQRAEEIDRQDLSAEFAD